MTRIKTRLALLLYWFACDTSAPSLPTCINIKTDVSRKKGRLCSLLSIAAAMALFYSSGAMAANCTFTFSDSGNKPATLNFGSRLTSDSLTIPQDAPIGTVIYEESLQKEELIFTCKSSSRYGLVMSPALGVPSGNTFPLGKTGLSFRIKSPNPHIPDMPPPFTIDKGTYTTSGGTYTLQIFKSAELSANSVVAAGELGQFKADDLLFIKFNLANPVYLNSASCQAPAVSVRMGDDYRLVEFDKVGATPRVIKFNLALHQCQRGIKKVTYQLKATTQVLDAQKGLVALNTHSTAKGIGLQLMDEAGNPIALDTTYPFNAFNTTGTDFFIPLSAAYYRLAGSTLEAGTANTEVTFIISYL
ncbi:fimbrial protein [Pseudomonas donghuensis]|uniref:fimbrial protein n=1 Tax=Pseudomonas donghuensis TaxID=1163398 RepID=UPI0020C4684D|nr:fimbrial protein [Pseudomonas donghuensis]MCP6698070.1 fimbrial protein [Pseudomonas donghuensis]